MHASIMGGWNFSVKVGRHTRGDLLVEILALSGGASDLDVVSDHAAQASPLPAFAVPTLRKRREGWGTHFSCATLGSQRLGRPTKPGAAVSW